MRRAELSFLRYADAVSWGWRSRCSVAGMPHPAAAPTVSLITSRRDDSRHASKYWPVSMVTEKAAASSVVLSTSITHRRLAIEDRRCFG